MYSFEVGLKHELALRQRGIPFYLERADSVLVNSSRQWL
jgi:hypothetical protein